MQSVAVTSCSWIISIIPNWQEATSTQENHWRIWFWKEFQIDRHTHTHNYKQKHVTVITTTEQNNSREDEQGGISIVCFQQYCLGENNTANISPKSGRGNKNLSMRIWSCFMQHKKQQHRVRSHGENWGTSHWEIRPNTLGRKRNMSSSQ